LWGRLFSRGRWLWIVPGVLLFFLVFLLAISYTLPGSVILSLVRPFLAKSGVEISAETARTEFPLGIRLENAAFLHPGTGELRLDTIRAGWEWTGLLRWLPVHVTVSKGDAMVQLYTSPRFWNPGKGRILLENVASGEFASLLPPSASGTGFLLESAKARWTRSSSGEISGRGNARFVWLRVPIRQPSSPIREAVLQDVKALFAVQGRSLIVSSISGTYEGAHVEGTGEIAEFISLPGATITFHLRIENPLEGKIAVLFDLLAKNAKNATLRIRGPLLSPTGEFQFF
jgi:hypothetical protein